MRFLTTKSIWFCIFFVGFISQNLKAQNDLEILSFEQIARQFGSINEKALRIAEEEEDSIVITQIIDTLQLPFIDDFTSTFWMPDTNLWLIEGEVTVSNNFPLDPPTYNTAAFNGVKRDGSAYLFVMYSNGTFNDTEIDGMTDFLTSKPINLEGFTPDSNVALSFYYQNGGVMDKLGSEFLDYVHLFFKDTASEWVRVWPVDPEEMLQIEVRPAGHPYVKKFIRITDPAYLHAGFQFEFRSRGRVTGNWDMWNVDYVYLDKNRITDDVLDVAFVDTPGSLLKAPYTSVPLRQFKLAPLDYLTEVVSSRIKNISNSDTVFVGPDTITVREINTGTICQQIVSPNSAFPNAGQIGSNETMQLDYNPNRGALALCINTIDRPSISLKNTMKFSRTAEQLLERNDSISRITHLDKFFAYDDGTAEGGIGILRYGQVAVEFDLKTPDTLSTIYIHFPKYILNFSTQSINIRVWEQITGVDGKNEDVLRYTFPFPVQYNFDEPDGFHAYVLTTPIVLPAGKFYVGYEQNINERLYVGFDANTSSLNKVYTNVDGDWRQDFVTRFQGSMMIRPKFGFGPDLVNAVSTTYDDVSLADQKQFTINLYPNPAQHNVVISSNESIARITLYDLTGRIHFDESYNRRDKSQTIDVQPYQSGVYILKVTNQQGAISTQKLVVVD